MQRQQWRRRPGTSGIRGAAAALARAACARRSHKQRKDAPSKQKNDRPTHLCFASACAARPARVRAPAVACAQQPRRSAAKRGRSGESEWSPSIIGAAVDKAHRQEQSMLAPRRSAAHGTPNAQPALRSATAALTAATSTQDAVRQQHRPPSQAAAAPIHDPPPRSSARAAAAPSCHVTHRAAAAP